MRLRRNKNTTDLRINVWRVNNLIPPIDYPIKIKV
jgi:hypothetical protein